MNVLRVIRQVIPALMLCLIAQSAHAVELGDCKSEYNAFISLHEEYLGPFTPGKYFDGFEDSSEGNIPWMNAQKDIETLKVWAQVLRDGEYLPVVDEFDKQWDKVSHAHRAVTNCLFDKRIAEVAALPVDAADAVDPVDPSEPIPVTYEDMVKGCDKKVALDCLTLGYMYRDGKGIEKDHIVSVSFFRKACDYADLSDPYGGATGCYILASYYESGDGMMQDLTMAIKLYDRGCKGGVEESCSQARIVRLATGAS